MIKYRLSIARDTYDDAMILAKNEIISKEFGKVYSQLFTWRQKGDYDDLFDFERDKVLPYFDPVKELIDIIEEIIKS